MVFMKFYPFKASNHGGLYQYYIPVTLNTLGAVQEWHHQGREGGRSTKTVTSIVSDCKFYCFHGNRGGREVWKWSFLRWRHFWMAPLFMIRGSAGSCGVGVLTLKARDARLPLSSRSPRDPLVVSDSGSALVKLSYIFPIPLPWKTCKNSCLFTSIIYLP